MSEAIFIEGETRAHPYMKQVKTAAFGTAGVSISALFGRVYRISAINGAATEYFLQIHDKATPPIAGNVPIWECRLRASLDRDLDFGPLGLALANGFGIAISTTPGLLTLAAANDATVYAQYTVSK